MLKNSHKLKNGILKCIISVTSYVWKSQDKHVLPPLAYVFQLAFWSRYDSSVIKSGRWSSESEYHVFCIMVKGNKSSVQVVFLFVFSCRVASTHHLFLQSLLQFCTVYCLPQLAVCYMTACQCDKSSNRKLTNWKGQKNTFLFSSASSGKPTYSKIQSAGQKHGVLGD